MRLTHREAEDALELPRVRAFLRVIRQGESSQEDSAYRMRWGGLGKPVAWFDDFSRHPRIFEPTRGGQVSSAAGAYQITATTWDSIAPPLGLYDFSPRSQDVAAVALIARRGALASVFAGNLEDAIAACREEWTSLPGAAENHERWTMVKARDLFDHYVNEFRLSDLTDQTPAPIEDRSTYHEEEKPMAPLLIPILATLAQSLIGAFAPLAQDKIASAVNKATKAGDKTVGDGVAKTVVDAATKAVTALLPPAMQDDKMDEKKAIIVAAKALESPEAIAAAEKAALDYLDAIAPMVDKMVAMEKATWAAEEDSRDRAAQRAAMQPAGEDMAKPLLRFAMASTLLVMVFVFAVALVQLFKNGAISVEVWTTVGGIVTFATGVVLTIVAYRFGASRQSNVQQSLINKVFERR